MKNRYTTFIVALLIGFTACNDDDNNEIIEDSISSSIEQITKLKATSTAIENEILLSWKNPNDEHLLKIEISYKVKDESGTRATPNPVVIDALKGDSMSYKLSVPCYAKYTIGVSSINRAGAKSCPVYIETSPFKIGIIEKPDLTHLLLERADTLMTSMTKLFLDGKARDIWTSTYPWSSGYWDGAAVIWGHGGAFSGYAALKEAAHGITEYQQKYENIYDDRLLTGIDQFRNKRGGKAEAYAVYPGDGDERYYDDNIWVGLDMVDLYLLTGKTKYLDRAKLVWDFVLEGTDEKMGGGIYWKEELWSKHTCSTAPGSVLAAKLYKATGEGTYLQASKDLYAWCKKMLQDPSDYLYWDNVHLANHDDPDAEIIIGKDKHTYNSGQPMQAAVLLYNITKESEYLTDAQNIAKSAYSRWFMPFNSYLLGESFYILEPGHVWFQAIMLRGFIELYKADKDRTYVDAYEKTFAHAWISSCRDQASGLLRGDFRGGTNQNQWDVLHVGATIEMLARLASLERDGL